MGRVDEYRAELRGLDPSEWPTYLKARSGLPGARANIELAQAVAQEADAAGVDEFIATDDEYLVFCGVVGVCEPRLLRRSEAAATAIDVCDRTTRSLAARPLHERRDSGVRALRQGLGYCWSVAVPVPSAGCLASARCPFSQTQMLPGSYVKQQEGQAGQAPLTG